MTNAKLREDADYIINYAINAVLPGEAVAEALKKLPVLSQIHVVAVGKAAYKMAETAWEFYGDKIVQGLVVTKYGHAGNPKLPGAFQIIEAGHPVPDMNSVAGAMAALNIAGPLGRDDFLLLLLSGGGSALFEMPADGLVLEDIEDATRKLLACGADITEINAVRKRLSRVKGGRFAQAVYPARVCSVILSDVLTDDPATIASGPACPDPVDNAFVNGVLKKYNLSFDEKTMKHLATETPKALVNAEVIVCGGVRHFARHAADAAMRLGYVPHILTSSLNCEAREAGRFLGAVGREAAYNAVFNDGAKNDGSSMPLDGSKNDGLYLSTVGVENGVPAAPPGSVLENVTAGGAYRAVRPVPPCAVIAGGETVVTLKGGGKGGRSQELALAAAEEIAGLTNVAVFSVGSDGTDGPTDAAGGIVFGDTKRVLMEQGVNIPATLNNNDSYRALKQCGGLIITGPTGTNVNDVSVVLVR